VNSSSNCPVCKKGYFREYMGTGCVIECPIGMYGNYKKQQCFFLPVVTSLTPNDGSIFAYGTFIDLTAAFIVKNSEKNTTYVTGWKVIRN
jgi:hypothetical protein